MILNIAGFAGISLLNHMTILKFAMPEAVMDGPPGQTATTACSNRLNTSFAPRADYLADAAALPRFLLAVGGKGEVFHADLFEPAMQAVTDKGRYEIVPGVGHLDMVSAPETPGLIKDFLNEL